MIREIFNKFKQLRIHRGWSTHELAEKTGMHQPTISRLENDQVTSVERLDDYISRMITVFDIKPEDIFPDGLDHLPPEIKTFVKGSENLPWIKKAYHEKELAALTRELPAQKD